MIACDVLPVAMFCFTFRSKLVNFFLTSLQFGSCLLVSGFELNSNFSGQPADSFSPSHFEPNEKKNCDQIAVWLIFCLFVSHFYPTSIVFCVQLAVWRLITIKSVSAAAAYCSSPRCHSLLLLGYCEFLFCICLYLHL